MKKVLFIGNRVNTLEVLLNQQDFSLTKLLIFENSLAEGYLKNRNIEFTRFSVKDKEKVISIIKTSSYDILISNGCPFKLPILEVNNYKDRLFINIHPSKLPELKGINPINGTFLHKKKHLSATVHFMDSKIDTGNIIFQKTVRLTKDIDLGLAYFIAFELEGIALEKALEVLKSYNYKYKGVKQLGKGSYYSKQIEDYALDFKTMTTDLLIRKISAFNIESMGATWMLNNHEYKLFDAEEIINPFLLKFYSMKEAGELLKSYENKLLIRTIDGIIKVNKFIKK